MDGWTRLDTHIRSLQLWNCMKLCETRAKTLVPRFFLFFFWNCWWKAPNVCGAKGCEWLWEGLYKRCDSWGSRRLCIFHLAVGRGKGRTSVICIYMLFTCQLCTQQTPFRKAYFFGKDMPLLAVGDIYMKIVGYLWYHCHLFFHAWLVLGSSRSFTALKFDFIVHRSLFQFCRGKSSCHVGCLPCTYHHQASVPDYSSTLVTLYQAMQGRPRMYRWLVVRCICSHKLVWVVWATMWNTAFRWPWGLCDQGCIMDDVWCAYANRNWFHTIFHCLTLDLQAEVEKRAFRPGQTRPFGVFTKSETNCIWHVFILWTSNSTVERFLFGHTNHVCKLTERYHHHPAHPIIGVASSMCPRA